MVSMRVLLQSWIWNGMVILKEEIFKDLLRIGFLWGENMVK